MRGEVITKKNNIAKCTNATSATAKSLYDKLFQWIVFKINLTLRPETMPEFGSTTIGILDIFGFENFEVNGFDQMCINLANEQLHYFFNQHIFAAELGSYAAEGLELSVLCWPTLCGACDFVQGGHVSKDFLDNECPVYSLHVVLTVPVGYTTAPVKSAASHANGDVQNVHFTHWKSQNLRVPSAKYITHANDRPLCVPAGGCHVPRQQGRAGSLLPSHPSWPPEPVCGLRNLCGSVVVVPVWSCVAEK